MLTRIVEWIFHDYLYDTRYAGECGELIGSSFTGSWRHQTKKGGLKEAAAFVLYHVWSDLNICNRTQTEYNADIPYPQRGNQ